VWRVFTDPKLVPKWYGPTADSMTRCEIDLRPGGKFLFVWGTPPQAHEMPGHFTEENGLTKVSMLADLGTKALRDEMLGSGWVEGMEACDGFLDALLPKL